MEIPANGGSETWMPLLPFLLRAQSGQLSRMRSMSFQATW
jgi:hypothetical protein